MRSIFSTILAAGMLWACPVSADCICRNAGVEVIEGNTACIKTANGGRMALCEKNINVTNWKFSGEECPLAQRPPDTAVKIAQAAH